MKVLFLPNNTASLMNLSVSALRERGVDAVGFNFSPIKFQTNTNVLALPEDDFQKFFFIFKFLYHLFTCDRIHWIYGGSSKIGIILQYCVGLLVWKKKFVEFCGTDVRILEKIIRDVPSYKDMKFSDEQIRLLGTNETSLETQRRFSLLGFQALGNSPEIMDYIDPQLFPKSQEIPRAIDTDQLKPFEIINSKPVVFHIPSCPEIKGTDVITKVCRDLEAKNLITFKNLFGSTHQEVLTAMRSSDIVIDQLLIGEFGVVTLEALALNKKVICFLRPSVEKVYRNRFANFPVINASVFNLSEVLKDVIGSLRGGETSDFIERNYSRLARTNRLLEIYGK